MKLSVQQVDARTTWVCFRVDNGSSARLGGRVDIVGPGSATTPALPTVDTNWAACATTTPNAAPGPHPYDRGQTLGVDHEVDVWSGPGEAWVCIRAGTSGHRVKVPTGTPAVPTPPSVTYRPDTGTPPG